MSRFVGTRTLFVSFLRRDRWMLLGWIGANVAVYWSQAVGTKAIYPTQADLDRAAASMESNPAFIALAGPTRALDTIGGQVAWQSSVTGAVLAALMSMFLVTRHTRAEEESGRDELVRSSVVGRDATVAATILLALLANGVLAAGITGSLVGYGLSWTGCFALGASAGLCGLVFGAVALVSAQVVRSARAANGLTGAVIGIAYVLRAIGDVGPGALTWVSPIGWSQAVRAFAGERWWPLGLLALTATALTVGAVALLHRRDYAGAPWPVRPGPARGALHTDLGLVWRLQRASVIGWSVGLFVGGVSYGSVGDGVEDLLGDSATSRDIFLATGGGDLVDSFYGVAVVMLAMITCGFTVTSVLRMRGEEVAGHAEMVLATAVPRARWAAAHLTITAVGTVAGLLLAGLGLGLGYAAVTADSAAVFHFVPAAAQQLLSVLLVGAIAWVGYAWRSRSGVLGWVAVAFCFVVLMFASVLQLPGWVQDLSPFHRLPMLPAEAFDLGEAVLVGASTVLLVVIGHVLMNRRDITNQ
ncbi:MAG TPA: hypothetical protein VNZ66_09955 [Aeromicrobium sp.]|nr:hypothetical protein [Aeromicrobium sp.]